MLATSAASLPALVAICLMGACSARSTMSAPTCCSLLSSLSFPVSVWLTRYSATPPPGTTPSSTAALVACSASSMRIFFSLSSVSVAAPTFITATPPVIFASLFWRFSFL